MRMLIYTLTYRCTNLRTHTHVRDVWRRGGGVPQQVFKTPAAVLKLAHSAAAEMGEYLSDRFSVYVLY
jgi:hypothetical protein